MQVPAINISGAVSLNSVCSGTPRPRYSRLAAVFIAAQTNHLDLDRVAQDLNGGRYNSDHAAHVQQMQLIPGGDRRRHVAHETFQRAAAAQHTDE